MATRTLLRPTTLPFSHTTSSTSTIITARTQQIRHATLLTRPHRPYTFTQLVSLSDGSTFTIRTTSPAAVHRSTQDSRNTPMWQPSLDSLRNVEKDEAGRLRAFRERFGRGWDATEGGGEEEAVVKMDGDGKGDGKVEGKKAEVVQEDVEDSLFDLISGAAAKGKKS